MPYDSMGTLVQHPWGGPYEAQLSFKAKRIFKRSFGLVVGTFFPVADIGQDGKLAITVETNTTFYRWTSDTIQYSPHASRVEDVSGMDFGLYTSIDLKFGADAMLDKYRPLMYGFGLGVAPTVILFDYEDIAKARVKAVPFIRSEVGFCFGLAMKLQATYQLASVFKLKSSHSGWFTDPGYRSTRDTDNDYTESSMRTTNNFYLSLIMYLNNNRWDGE